MAPPSPDPGPGQLISPVEGAVAGSPPPDRRERLAAKGGGSLRAHTAGSMLVNAAFSIGLQGLSFLRGFVVAIFLAPADYGIWAIIVVSFLTLGTLKQVGFADKYVQQDDPDEVTAFQKAFTLEAILTGVFVVLLALATPLIALIYDAPEIIAPALVSLLAAPATVLHTPIWAFTREMEFRRLRKLSAVDPVVGVFVTVGFAIAGFGYWSFVAGTLAGAWIGAVVIVRNSPYPLRFRYDSGTARQYVRFSRPLFLSRVSNSLLLQGTTLSARYSVGIAGVGAMSLANTIRMYTEFADGIISSTMYPAIAAIKERRELLFESFVKSNRFALMWALPVGIGVAFFAEDLLRYVLGQEWTYATVLFQAAGLVSAIAHIGFNWDAYFRALDDTKPIATYAWIALAAWGIGPIPLLFTHGLEGYSAGMFLVAVVTLAVRAHFLRRLFPGFAILRHVLRAVAPTVPAVALLAAVRLIDPVARSAWVAAAELVLYAGVICLVTWLAERALLREAMGYLRRSRRARPEPAT